MPFNEQVCVAFKMDRLGNHVIIIINKQYQNAVN